MGIEDLKSPARLLNRDYINKGGLDLSNKVLWVSVAHWEFVARFISKFQKHCFCKDLTFSGTSDLKRHQEDHKILKKANKGCKGHFRGQRVKKWKNIDFIAFL